jgi:hypothetical protein
MRFSDLLQREKFVFVFSNVACRAMPEAKRRDNGLFFGHTASRPLTLDFAEKLGHVGSRIKSRADALANLPSRARWFPQGDAATSATKRVAESQPSSVKLMEGLSMAKHIDGGWAKPGDDIPQSVGIVLGGNLRQNAEPPKIKHGSSQGVKILQVLSPGEAAAQGIPTDPVLVISPVPRTPSTSPTPALTSSPKRR